MRALLYLFCVLALAGVVRAQEPRPKPPLPDDVAAIVYDELVSMDQFRDSLIRRFVKTPEGKKCLENLVEELVVRAEGTRRGIKVTDAELQAYVKKVEQDVRNLSHRTQTLADLLKQREVTREEFLETSRDYLVRQRLAAADLGLEDEVSPGQLGIWLADLLRKSGAVIGGANLPAGVFARVGKSMVGSRQYGDALLAALPQSTLAGALWDLVISRAVQKRLAKWKIKVTDADMERAVAELEKVFRADPRFANTSISFEQYIEGVRHMSLADLKQDRLFRAQVGLGISIRRRLTAEEVKAHYESHAGRYGEQRKFIHLLIKADDRKGTFDRPTRSYEEAKRKINALHAEHLRGAPFEKLVMEDSEDRTKYSRPDRVIHVNRETALPDPLKEAVFLAPAGEVVGPIRSPFGYHLLKVTEISPAPGFESIRGDVMSDLVRERRTKALLEIKQDEQIRLKY